MGSRQNRDTRAEYPTGHNKGNDSPPRRANRVRFDAPAKGRPSTAEGRAMQKASRQYEGSGGSDATAGGAGGVGPPPKVIPEYGTPIGGPPEVNPEREKERKEKEGRQGSREEYEAGVAEQEEGSKRETIREENRKSKDPKPEQGTDLSAFGAGKTILDRRNPVEPPE